MQYVGSRAIMLFLQCVRRRAYNSKTNFLVMNSLTLPCELERLSKTCKIMVPAVIILFIAEANEGPTGAERLSGD